MFGEYQANMGQVLCMLLLPGWQMPNRRLLALVYSDRESFSIANEFHDNNNNISVMTAVHLPLSSVVSGIARGAG